MNSIRCEFRVPTCRRPAWLHRALSSLLAQTHADWVAIVLDDSPAQEGAAVVRNLADPRIHYRANGRNLGAAANLDLAFQSTPLLGGEFACVVEDDNWILPRLLESNLQLTTRTGARVIVRNQQIWKQSGGTFVDTGRTTRGAWFREGWHSPLQVRARLFFNEGISNGGLFWHTAGASDFQVGPPVTITGVQEYCRTLGVREPLWFAAEPLAVWTDLEPAAVIRGRHSNRTFARAIQQLRIALVRHHGETIIAEARRVATEHQATAALSAGFADLTPLQRTRYRLPPTLPSLKGFLRYLLVTDPLREFFATPRF